MNGDKKSVFVSGISYKITTPVIPKKKKYLIFQTQAGFSI